MKPRLIAFLLILTITSCKKDYSYEGGTTHHDTTTTTTSNQKCDLVTDKVIDQGLPALAFGFESPPRGNGYRIYVNQQDYNTHKQGDHYCWTPICASIVRKSLINGTIPDFKFGDIPFEAEVHVGTEIYNMYREGEIYCNIPRCGYVTAKVIQGSNTPVIWYADTPTGFKNFFVAMPVDQATYNKWKVGDYFCYTP